MSTSSKATPSSRRDRSAPSMNFLTAKPTTTAPTDSGMSPTMRASRTHGFDTDEHQGRIPSRQSVSGNGNPVVKMDYIVEGCL